MSGALSPVARGKPGMGRWTMAAVAAGCVLAAGGTCYWLFLWPDPPKPVAAVASGGQSGVGFDFGQPLHEAAAPPASSGAAPPPEPKFAPPPRAAPPSAAAAPPDVVTVAPMVMWVRPNSDSLLRKPEVAPGGATQDGPNSPPGQQSAYAQSISATRIADTKPLLRRFPSAFTIKKGLVVGCTPPMALDTQLPGPLWCLIDTDVKSMDGNNILMPAGTQVNMQVERGLGLGQNRAVVLMTDALTPGPDFIPIPLDVVGADSGGQNGVPVDVNEHTWQKLKTAAFAAVIEGGSGALQNALSTGGNQYVSQFGNQTQSLASVFAQHDVNIPITGYRGPGRSIAFYVNHYIDLSNIYEDRMAGR